MTKWIQDWFGSDHYSVLYKHRDDAEAKRLIGNLTTLLGIPSGSCVMDCGCGKGRHSIQMQEKGFQVTGLDISEKSISCAKKYEGRNLTFYSHDLRNLFRINYYEAALCLFTSFGYFENDAENNKVVKSIGSALKKNGWFVLDFMNAEKEIKELIPEQICRAGNFTYKMKRGIENGCIVKEIIVTEDGKEHSFRERVKAYKRKDLENFFVRNGLEVVHLLGDYDLNPFDVNTSERMILIGKKK